MYAPSLLVNCLVALFITANVGMLVELFHKDAAAQQLDQALDQQVRREMLSLGWLPPRSPTLFARANQLRVSHGVELMHAERDFELSLDNGTLRGTPARQLELDAATVVIADELSLLPDGFLHRSALRRVLLCGNLSEARRPVPSLPNYRNTLLIDVHAPREYLRRLLHHEVFHFSDLADDGDVIRDDAWEALNAPTASYGHGGRALREPNGSLLLDGSAGSEQLPGFVSLYATAAVEEDKAEVFAFMLTAPDAIASMAARDPVIARKVQRMKAMVQALSEDMDDRYWLRLQRTRTHQ